MLNLEQIFNSTQFRALPTALSKGGALNWVLTTAILTPWKRCCAGWSTTFIIGATVRGCSISRFCSTRSVPTYLARSSEAFKYEL